MNNQPSTLRTFAPLLVFTAMLLVAVFLMTRLERKSKVYTSPVPTPGPSPEVVGEPLPIIYCNNEGGYPAPCNEKNA